MFDTSEVSTDELEALLVAHERVIAQHRAAQLETLRVLDQRQVAATDGCRTMIEWTTGRLDLDTPTAQALVTASRALETNDPLWDGLAGGECSFDRALATMVLRQTGIDDHTVGLSAGLDVPGVRRLAARWKHRTTSQYHDTYGSRHLVIQPDLQDATWRMWATLPGYEGRIVEKALNETADELPANPGSWATRRADALVTICADSLTANATSGEPTLVVHLHTSETGRAALSLNNGMPLGEHTLERLLCTAKIDVQSLTTTGTPLGVGRVTRTIPPRLVRHIIGRDQSCTAEGCTSRNRLQAHHITPWSQGGTTNPDNLTTLCWYHHHTIIHGQGHQIDPTSPPGRLRFTPPP